MSNDNQEPTMTKDGKPIDPETDDVPMVMISCKRNNPLQLNVSATGSPMDVLNILDRVRNMMLVQAVKQELASVPRITPANVLPFGRSGR